MKGSGKTSATCRFFYNLEPEILRLRTELLNNTYQPGAYRYFKIFDPKERVIAVAPFRDRVVHHAVVRILTPIYERVFIYDSYATRPNKGTHAAIKRAQKFIRRWHWYLKADIEKYFDHVDHDILLGIIERKIKDRQLLRLLDRLIRNTATAGKGIPIGNLTSQFLANVYLDPFDHEIKDKLGIKEYLRYMDDFVLFGYSKPELQDLNRVIKSFLSERLRLSLKVNSTWLNRSSHGLSFLGMRIFPRFIRVKPENRKRSMKRMKDVIENWRTGKVDEETMAQSLTSIAGHLRYFCPNTSIALEVGAGKKAVRTG
jgi:retron-type reverse transcriptase